MTRKSFNVSLNLEQQEALKFDGPVLIVAGPGTGKTQTLIAKIEYLITQKNIDPHSILALTFTNKAANEIKNRLNDLTVLPQIFTFHGFAYDVLTQQNRSLQILSDSEKKVLLTKAVFNVTGSLPLDKEVKELELNFSLDVNFPTRNISLIRQSYEELKKKEHKCDFEDLLLALKEKIAISEVSTFTHILVDEFQDTNRLQYEIVKSLLATDNIFVIGDPYQSIYKFRGSDGAIFKIFKKDFPHHTTITLTKNYRSNNTIISASNALLSGKRELISTKGQSDEDGVFIVSTINEYTEADWIVDKIVELVGGTDLLQRSNSIKNSETSHFSEIAVIYRTHSLRRHIEKKLQSSGIPFQVIGEDSFWGAREMQFVFSILEYLVQPTPQTYLKALLTSVPPFSKKVNALISMENYKDITLQDYTIHIRDLCKGHLNDIHILSTIVEFLEGLSQIYKNQSIIKVIHSILTFIETNSKNEKMSLRDNINQLTSIAYRYSSLVEFVSYMNTFCENDYYDPHTERVSLMTMHSSKGLEFEHVFIPAFEEGYIPYVKHISDLQEERNLCYVALTRAKKSSYLLSPQYRNGKTTKESIFISEIKKDSKHLHDDLAQRYLLKKEKIKQKKNQMKLF